MLSSAASSRYITSYDGPPSTKSPPGRGSGCGIRCGPVDLGGDPSGQRGLGGVEDDHDATPAGVDHPGVAQHLELVRGPGQGLARRGGRDGEHVA